VTPPNDPRHGGVPTTRVVLWSIVALALLLGLYLYFRFGQSVTPVLGQLG
jgi:hypothetical protein